MVEFFILGPVQVRVDGLELAVGGPRERKLLAVLLLAAGRVVAVDRVVEALWGPDPPATVDSQVRNTLAALRRSLRGAGPVPVRRGAGYVLDLTGAWFDASAFIAGVDWARRLAEGRRLAEAVQALRQVLGLWRGPALAGMDGSVLAAAALRWEEQRLACVEQRLEWELALGGHREVSGELSVLVAEYPLRERLVELLMLALHRAGRRQDALDVFAATRARLAEQTGLDPRPQLSGLQQAILRGDPTLDPPTNQTQLTTAQPDSVLLDAAAQHGRAEDHTVPDGVVHDGVAAGALSVVSSKPDLLFRLPADIAGFSGRVGNSKRWSRWPGVSDRRCNWPASVM